jgi:hypothetical protein
MSYTLTSSDVGHTIRLVETASNAAGAGQPTSSVPTALVVAAPKPAHKPSCTIRAKSASVLLPPRKTNAHHNKSRRSTGRVSFVVRCDQAAKVTLRGRLIEVVKRGSSHRKAFSLPGAHGSARENLPLTLTINIPRAALTALRAHAHESVTVTLSATDANGNGKAAAKIPRLKPVST